MNPSVQLDIKKGTFVVMKVTEQPGASRTVSPATSLLKPGDRIMAIRQSNGRTSLVTGLFTLGDMVREMKAGEVFFLEAERRGDSGIVRLSVPIQVIAPVWSAISWLLLLVTFASLLPILTATLIGYLNSEDQNAFWASLLFLSFNTIFSAPTYLFPHGLRDGFSFLFAVLNGALIYILLRFFLLFPSPSWIDRKAPWLKHFCLYITLLFIGVDVFNGYAINYSIVLLELVPDWISKTSVVFALTMFVLAIFSLVLNTFSKKGRDERRRMAILLFGTIFGLLPTGLFLVFLPLKVPPMWMIFIIISTLTIFPLSFIYAVVKHRVLGIRVILRQGLKYTLVSRGFLVLEGLFIFILIGFTNQPLLLHFFPQLGPNWLALLAAGLALAGMAGLKELNRWLFPRIDRRFFREAYNAQQVLTDLRRKVRHLAAQPEQLLWMVSDCIGKALYPNQIALFLRGPIWEAAGPGGHLMGTGTAGSWGDGFYAPAIQPPPASNRKAITAPESNPQEKLVLLEQSFIGRQLAFMAQHEPETLEVYLDDPKSWTQALVSNAAVAEQAYQERLLLEKLKARLLVPLIAGQQILGFLCLGEKLSEEPYSRDDKELLLTLAEQVAIALDYSRLIKQVAEQEKLKRELEIAQEVQAQLFPQILPVLPGLDYAGLCRAARGVGGDYFDFLLLEPGKLGLALGDISGKGIAAALLMAGLQAALRSYAPIRGGQLGLLAADLNRLMCASVDGSKYATFFYCLYEDHSRQLTYVNAGHNPPLLFHPFDLGGNDFDKATSNETAMLLTAGCATTMSVERLEASGTVIGLFPDISYESRIISCLPGDILVIYSDGVTEARNEKEEEFGEERLQAMVQMHGHLSAQELLQLLLKEVIQFAGSAPQHDDLTLVIAKIR